MSVKCILTGQTPSVLDGVTENVQTQLNDKVDKVTGKGLSTNDYTDAEKTKLSSIETGAQKNTITGVKGNAETTYRTGNVNITATNIGLGNINNTSDAEKPISTATQTALDGKQATITGAATTITDNNLTANRALISNSSGKVEVSAVTSTELGYLDGVTSNIQTQLNSKLSSAPVTSVNNKTGAVTLTKGDVGLGNVNNTSDANKPISNATQTALNNKQSKITANGILKGDGSGNITAANETEVELVSLPNICNPNLLDNWYFGNPVNQRGQTSYTGSGYTVDRWKNTQKVVTTTVNSSGYLSVIRATGQWNSLIQIIDNWKALAGKTVTISILLDDGYTAEDNAYIRLTDISTETNYGSVSLRGGERLRSKTIVVPEDVSSIAYSVYVGQTALNILAVKLELGSQQTLAHQENGAWVLNEIPDYGEQLRRCQRYCKVYGNISPNFGQPFFPIGFWREDSGSVQLTMVCPEFRTIPVVSVLDGDWQLFDGKNVYTYGQINVTSYIPGVVTLVITSPGNSFSSGKILALFANSGKLMLSADL